MPVRRTYEFDSTGAVIVHNQFLNSDVDMPMALTFDQYLKQRQQWEMDEGFRNTLHQTQGTTKLKEEGLFPSGFNEISIPIPPSIVPSIFGT